MPPKKYKRRRPKPLEPDDDARAFFEKQKDPNWRRRTKARPRPAIFAEAAQFGFSGEPVGHADHHVLQFSIHCKSPSDKNDKNTLVKVEHLADFDEGKIYDVPPRDENIIMTYRDVAVACLGLVGEDLPCDIHGGPTVPEACKSMDEERVVDWKTERRKRRRLRRRRRKSSSSSWSDSKDEFPGFRGYMEKHELFVENKNYLLANPPPIFCYLWHGFFVDLLALLHFLTFDEHLTLLGEDEDFIIRKQFVMLPEIEDVDRDLLDPRKPVGFRTLQALARVSILRSLASAAKGLLFQFYPQFDARLIFEELKDKRIHCLEARKKYFYEEMITWLDTQSLWVAYYFRYGDYLAARCADLIIDVFTFFTMGSIL